MEQEPQSFPPKRQEGWSVYAPTPLVIGRGLLLGSVHSLALLAGLECGEVGLWWSRKALRQREAGVSWKLSQHPPKWEGPRE